jgi:hypothetical protein
MSLTPVPFLRVGFAILGLSLACAIWTADGAGSSAWSIGYGLAAIGASVSLGELVLRRALTHARAVSRRGVE